MSVEPESAGVATITVTATDAEGSNTGASQRFVATVWSSDAVDYDADDDGLIDIANLAQLDAVRHDLDGDGVADPATLTLGSGGDPAAYAAAFPNAVEAMGCSAAIGKCFGYELEADLDFDTDGSGAADAGDTYWNGGAGWMPIGGVGSVVAARAAYRTARNPFVATFEGNGHAVANLFINRTEPMVGLFGFAGGFHYADDVIRNLRVVDAAVTGGHYTGALVGENRGLVTGCRSTGTVAGSYNVGGLAGDNGGALVLSSSASDVSGTQNVGGLVGDNHSWLILLGGSGSLATGLVSRSYATGDVAGTYRAGGLVGRNYFRGFIGGSYASGRVEGSFVGGLVGRNSFSRIVGSYATGLIAGGQASGGLVGLDVIEGKIVASYATGGPGLVGAFANNLGRPTELIVGSYWDSSISHRVFTT